MPVAETSTLGALKTPGERVRWLRLSKDFTQAKVGDDAACSQVTISLIERNLLVPRRRTREMVAAALGIHPDFIWRPEDLAARRRAA